MSYALHLKKLCESRGVPAVTETFGKAIAEKKIDPHALRLAELAEAFLGRDYYRAERKLKAVQSGQVHLLEASEAVDASAFSNITGQLLVTVIKEKYESPDFVADKLVKKVPNPGGNLKEHKIPYLSDVIDKGDKLAQAQEYPQTRFHESWVTMPAPEKYGQICAVTMEMVFSDLTGQAQDSAASVGRALGYLKEQRVLRVVLGITNPYKAGINGTEVSGVNTYLSTANATLAYVNKKLSSTVTNFTHINAVEQLFWKMSDPVTGRKIYVRPTTILCNPEKRYELKRILNATEVRSGDTDEATSTQTLAANPLDIKYQLVTSPIAQAILDEETALSDSEVKEYLVFGDFPRAFGYREVYPMKTEVAPPNNPAEFRQDIVLQVKASEFGVPYVYDPRYAVLSTAEAA